MEKLQKKKMTHEDKIEELETKLSLVSLTSEGYLDIRNRFVSMFRRDRMNQRSAVDRQAITAENLFSHAGDVLADALLYEKNMRIDQSTFTLLYGFTPLMITKHLSMLF